TQGARAYWICPLIEDNQDNELVATEERFKYLQDVFKERVGLVHGRMKTSKKDIIMNRFRDGDIDILVSTTVVEVGVDVPEASIIVIEHAERFGLSQLHQLRGRVGRGKTSSTCLLLYQPPLSETARIRLQTIRDSDDGFMIAEQDLKLRGSGELLGTRQSGLPEMKIANLAVHFDLLELAKKDADYVLNSDPLLNSERGTALRTLLYLFERDTAVQYLNSG
ncbi:MAG: helicase-related protein, partial [Pseudomonadota bacterium]|nr:helicase-related protein [Pseudomonadota bacterium]